MCLYEVMNESCECVYIYDGICLHGSVYVEL